MTKQGEKSDGRRRELTGRKVLLWFGGFFTLIIGVNVVMIYLAVSTFSGLETDDAYRKGRDYNEILKAAAKQDALGWKSEIILAKGENGKVVLSVKFEDVQARPIEGLNLVANVRRPTTDKFDIDLILPETEIGEYGQTFELPALGNWLVTIEAVNGAGDTYQVTDRVFVGS